MLTATGTQDEACLLATQSVIGDYHDKDERKN